MDHALGQAVFATGFTAADREDLSSSAWGHLGLNLLESLPLGLTGVSQNAMGNHNM